MDTIYGQPTTETRLQSETADNILWAQLAEPAGSQTFDLATASALSRIEFREVSASGLLRSVIEYAAALEASTADRRSRLLVVAGRSRRLAVEHHGRELEELAGEYGATITPEVRKTVGDVASSFIVCGSKASIVVLQAANADNN